MRTSNNKIIAFPLQPMPGKDAIELYAIKDLADSGSLVPHRHEFYMLFIVTKGIGSHYINFKKHHYAAGSVFFIHQDEIHQVEQYPEDGWIILFDQATFKNFLNIHKDQERLGLFEFFNQDPVVVLRDEPFTRLIQIVTSVIRGKTIGINTAVIQHYLYILLLLTNESYLNSQLQCNLIYELIPVKKLMALIEQNYKVMRDNSFYCSLMGMSLRKLQQLTLKYHGRLLGELIDERIIKEAKMMLAQTDFSVKEISFELGYTDQGYFTRFFKHIVGQPPTAYRLDLRKQLYPNKIPVLS